MKRELQNAADYFPYIGHEINHEKQGKEWIYRASVGGLMNKKNITWYKKGDQAVILGGKQEIFRRVEVNGLLKHKALAADSKAVEVIVPRHRTLYDYTIGQPVHHDLVNPEVMLLAGNNLFVFPFDEPLRTFGAFVFLRNDLNLKRKGLPPAFLTQERYINEVFPAYLKEQMITGIESQGKIIHRDFLMYPEQEKNPETKKRGGGRTKTGKLRTLSHILFDKLKGITKDSDIKLYVTPVNVSFSKVPEVPFIVYAANRSGLLKNLSYIWEQYFIYGGYPRFSSHHPEAKIDVVVNYGEPMLLDNKDFTSTRDLLKFSKDVQHRIGLLETIFPIPFLYRVMDQEYEISISEFAARAARLYAFYQELGINTEPISLRPGEMLPAEEIIEKSIITQNANPPFHIKQLKTTQFLIAEEGQLKSGDFKVHTWYANTIRHLDES